MTLLDRLKKVATAHPETRPYLIPIIKEAGGIGDPDKVNREYQEWLETLERHVQRAQQEAKKHGGMLGSPGAAGPDLVGFLNGMRRQDWFDFYFG